MRELDKLMIIHGEKLREMRGLVDVMKLNTRMLSNSESQELANIEMRLEFALKKLSSECRNQEADLKIKAMKDSLAVAKGEWHPTYE